MSSSRPFGQAKCAFSPPSPLPACVSSMPRDAMRATIAMPPQTPKSCSRGATPMSSRHGGKRRAGHAADAEHAVQVAHDRAAAEALELRAFGIDGDVEQAHRGAEDQHRRQQRGEPGYSSTTPSSEAHRQRRERRGLARAEPSDDAPGDEERQTPCRPPPRAAPARASPRSARSAPSPTGCACPRCRRRRRARGTEAAWPGARAPGRSGNGRRARANRSLIRPRLWNRHAPNSVRIVNAARSAKAAIVSVGGDAVIVGNVDDPTR